MRLQFFSLALAALAAPTLAQGQVWVVDAALGPGVDFTLLQDAVNAASDGDLILVEGGQHPSVVVDGVGLSIHNRQGILLDLVGDGPLLTVKNLAANQTVVVRNLGLIHVPTNAAQPSVLFEDNLGVVHYEGALVDLLGPGLAMRVQDSTAVTLKDVVVQGGGSAPGVTPAPSIDVQSSHLSLDDCFVLGPGGVTDPPGDGAPGVRLQGAELVVTSSTVRGGHGGSVFAACVQTGDGGAGVELLSLGGVDSRARVYGNAPQGGGPGSDLAGCGAPIGAQGLAFDVQGGSFQFTQGSQRTHTWASPVHSGAPLVTEYQGITGDLVLLVLSAQPIAPLELPLLGAPLEVAPDFVVALGAVPLPPPLESVLTAPQLPAGTQFREFHTQAVFVTAQGAVVLTARSVTAVTD